MNYLRSAKLNATMIKFLSSFSIVMLALGLVTPGEAYSDPVSKKETINHETIQSNQPCWDASKLDKDDQTNILFQDDFNDGSADGWTTAGDWSWFVDNGEYVVEQGSGTTEGSSSFAGELDWTNYIFEVDVKGETAFDKIVLVRYTDETNYYGVNLRSGYNDISLDRASSSITSASIENTNGVWYHIKTILMGPRILVYVNDTLYLDFTDHNPTPITHGKIGLKGWNSSTVRFDNIVVRGLTNQYLPLISKPCLPLYSDDFSNPSSGWPVGDSPSGNARFEYMDGEYRILVRATKWSAAASPGFQASDYTVSVDLRNKKNVWGSYGLAFEIASDWTSLYTLEIYPDGWYGLYRYDPGSLSILSEAYSPAIYAGSATNHIKVERNGDSINAFANGQLLVSVKDATYMGFRYFGLAVFSGSQPQVDIRFDNYTVYSVNCGGTNSGSNTANGWLPSPGQLLLDSVRIEQLQAKHGQDIR